MIITVIIMIISSMVIIIIVISYTTYMCVFAGDEYTAGPGRAGPAGNLVMFRGY